MQESPPSLRTSSQMSPANNAASADSTKVPIAAETSATTAAFAAATTMQQQPQAAPLVAAAAAAAASSAQPAPTAAALASAKPPNATPPQQQQQNFDSNSNSVITIRYANVSTTTNDDNSAAAVQVLKLYNEPLSVDVITSRFSTSIASFDVSHNQLSTLAKDLFCPLSNDVRTLNISHNLLENFDYLGLISQAGQLCLSELRVLEMSHNLIRHLPATGVATLQNLQVLNLSNNLIESLDELSLSSLFKLSLLDLSNNRLTVLTPATFAKSTSMQVLKLAHNSISVPISKSLLAGLTSLEQLDLSHNNISVVGESAFVDKLNLSRVDIRHNQIAALRQEALSVTSVAKFASPSSSFKHRVHHNGQLATVSPAQQQQQLQQRHSHATNVAEFLLAGNPFVCDCQLEWLKSINALRSSTTPTQQQQQQQQQQTSNSSTSTINKRLAIDATQQQQQQTQPESDSAAAEIASSNSNSRLPIAAAATAADSSYLSSSINIVNQQQQQQQKQQLQQVYGKVRDFEQLKCSPLFKRNTHKHQPQHQQHRRMSSFDIYSDSNYVTPDAQSYLSPPPQPQESSASALASSSTPVMIDLVTAGPSNFLCRYKSHCFALCQCCEFDACDCEMICPDNCNCYYDHTWQTNIVDCSANNHTAVPARIPMDVSGLYLDGNNINSLKPNVFIGRKSMRTLLLNSTNLHTIANRTFNGLIDLQVLHLNDNMLRVLNGYEFESLGQLKSLYLQSNRLEYINNATFINLRSLEELDLSQNRLTSQPNMQLFWSIGHHNVRLRQLHIAHNWWSCQCNSINQFRQILSVNLNYISIVDKNALRCYHNSTTVGPTILPTIDVANAAVVSSGPFGGLFSSLSSSSSSPVPRTGFVDVQGKQLNELNICNDQDSDDSIAVDSSYPNSSPPLVVDPSVLMQQSQFSSSQQNNNNYPPTQFMQQPAHAAKSLQDNQLYSNDNNNNNYNPMLNSASLPNPFFNNNNNNNNLLSSSSSNTPPQQRISAAPSYASLMILSFVGSLILFAVISLVLFVRQQRRYQRHKHHKKSAVAGGQSSSMSSSTTSSISSNSLGKHRMHPSHMLPNQLVINSPPNGDSGAFSTLARIADQNAIYAPSSQSNIYAHLTSPTPTSNAQHQQSQHLYNHATSSSSIYNFSLPIQHLNRTGDNQLIGHYASNSNHHQQQQVGYKTTTASAATSNGVGNLLYNAHNTLTASEASSNASSSRNALSSNLPKVKQLVSRLVNKSLAFGGYKSSPSRDELSSQASSDKIYDAYIAYDKQDETFVMQHLSAELEYGQPQYRVADKYRDLPTPSPAYVAEAIASLISCAQRTIVVLSDAFLANEWCVFELRAALREASADRAHRLIFVVGGGAQPAAAAAGVVGGGPPTLSSPHALAAALDAETRALLAHCNALPALSHALSAAAAAAADGCGGAPSAELLAVLAPQPQPQQVQAQATAARVAALAYGERKFWPRLKSLMPVARNAGALQVSLRRAAKS